LRSQGARLGEPGTEVQVTLSENVQSYLWVAQIRREQVAMTSLPRPPRRSPVIAIALTKSLIWEQAEPILDLATIGQRLLVLDSSKFALYAKQGTGWAPDQKVPLTHALPRDPRARLTMQGDQFRADLPGFICRGAIQPLLAVDCQASEDVAYIYDQNVELGAIPGWGSDIASIETDCAGKHQVLATKTGDYTEPDAVQAYELVDRKPVAVSAPIDFAGPVTALWPAGKNSALAVSRNLTTSRYEAFRLAASCSP